MTTDHLHAAVHSIVSATSESVLSHLMIATILSLMLLLVTVVARDPRIRRTAALAALLVFLVPLPDLLPSRGFESFDLAGVTFDATVGAVSTSSAERASSFHPACVATLFWLALSAILMVRSLRALRGSFAGSVELSAEMKARLMVPQHVSVRTSADTEGAHLEGVLRPVVVIPETLLREARQDELRAVLLHELAHLRQRDNFWGFVSAVATSLFWFHPITWIAALRFRAASEATCDAEVLESGVPLRVYLESLRRLVATSAAERSASIAFGGGSLKERIRIMKSSDRRVSRTAARSFTIVIALVTIGAGLSLRAMVGEEPEILPALAADGEISAYRFAHDIVPRADGSLQAEFAVIDIARGRLLAAPTITFPPGGTAAATTGTSRAGANGSQLEQVSIQIEPGATLDTVVAELTIDSEDEYFQRRFSLAIGTAHGPVQPVDFELLQATLHDTLKTFAQLIGADLLVAAEIESERVTISLHRTPWDRALDQILEGRQLQWRKIGDLLVVFGTGDGTIVRPPASRKPVSREIPEMIEVEGFGRAYTVSPGAGITAPRVLERVPPKYPDAAREARVMGIVIVSALIDEQGSVRDVKVIKPLPFGLNEATVEAVRQWKFAPATREGVAVPVLFNLTINYTLDE